MNRGIWILALGIWLSGCLGTSLAAPIPDTAIAALQAELREAARGTSSVAVRRACKHLIRNANGILDNTPDAPNRYAVIDVIFESQKRLLSLELTDQNRAAIFETAAELTTAPDEYAEIRFEADMLLSERALAEAEATVAERIEALTGMLADYRGTPAEWKSLMMGSLIAANLQAFDLAKAIQTMMFERFAGDHNAIMFRRKQNPGGEIDAVFSGTYKNAAGTSLVFPHDRMGHQYLLYFWSRETPGIDEHLEAVQAMQTRHDGQLDIYSFNLDKLPDAGAQMLRERGLDWTALHLPEGRESSAYRAYAAIAPRAVLVNGQGHVLLAAPPLRMRTAADDRPGRLGSWNLPTLEKRLDNERYLAQLRSLFIGDFLAGVSRPATTNQAILDCFVPSPFRYRLSRLQALENYRKAAALCASAIQTAPQAPVIRDLRNKRIIALLGMSNLDQSAAPLEAAIKEAEALLAMDLPPGEMVVANFCLAKKALRDGGIDPEALLADFMAAAGGDNASAPALAAAAILALEANARTAHERYREQLLQQETDDQPALWPVYAFLRDKHHRYRNFWASPGGYGYGRPQKYKFRDTVTGLLHPEDRNRRGAFELTTRDGAEIKVPGDASGEMLGVIFVEPPESSPAQSNLISQVNGFANTYAGRDVKVIVAFLSDDTNTVSELSKDLNADCKTGMLSGGLGNPLVRQLGILSPDRVPNPMLLRPDGTLAWIISGMDYAHFQSNPQYAISQAIQSNIAKVRSDQAFEVLARGAYRKSLALFDAYRSPDRRTDWWAADRHQGRALAYMGLQDWEAALTEIDAALEQRLADFGSAVCKCHGIVEMCLTKASILDRLDRGREAQLERRRAANENLPHAKLPPGIARQGVPVGVYYDQLKQIRRALEANGIGGL